MKLTEKIQDIITAGGYVGKNGRWNAVIFKDGKLYRDRVETIIVNDKGEIYLNIKNNGKDYKLPGGGVERDGDKAKQAAAECKEESRIIIKNVQFTGFVFVEDYPKNNNSKNENAIYDGKITSLFIARYQEQYRGHIPSVDIDKDMEYNGKFYNYEEIKDILREEHKISYENFIYGNNEFTDTKEKIYPYYTPEQMEELGVYNNEAIDNYFGVKASVDNSEWFKEYKETYDPGYKWLDMLKEAYLNYMRDKSKENKQTLLELGWNPEIDASNESFRIKISESTKSIIEHNRSCNIEYIER